MSNEERIVNGYCSMIYVSLGFIRQFYIRVPRILLTYSYLNGRKNLDLGVRIRPKDSTTQKFYEKGVLLPLTTIVMVIEKGVLPDLLMTTRLLQDNYSPYLSIIV